MNATASQTRTALGRPRRDVARPPRPRRLRRSAAGEWSAARITEALRAWSQESGRVPRSYDWSPAAARAGGFPLAGAQQWEREFPRWPHHALVIARRGSWRAALHAAGLPRTNPSAISAVRARSMSDVSSRAAPAKVALTRREPYACVMHLLGSTRFGAAGLCRRRGAAPQMVAIRRRAHAGLLAAVLVGALLGPVAIAEATVTPATGGERATFEVTFPAQAIVLDLRLAGPGDCANLDPLYISIRRAQTGRFRFGPRVPGARPRRNGQRVKRWCRGPYRVDLVALGEFAPSEAQVIATGEFTVR